MLPYSKRNSQKSVIQFSNCYISTRLQFFSSFNRRNSLHYSDEALTSCKGRHSDTTPRTEHLQQYATKEDNDLNYCQNNYGKVQTTQAEALININNVIPDTQTFDSCNTYKADVVHTPNNTTYQITAMELHNFSCLFRAMNYDLWLWNLQGHAMPYGRKDAHIWTPSACSLEDEIATNLIHYTKFRSILFGICCATVEDTAIQ